MFVYQAGLKIQTQVTKKSIVLGHEIMVYSSAESDVVFKLLEHIAVICT